MTLSSRLKIIPAAVVLAAMFCLQSLATGPTEAPLFFAKPYLQLGNHPHLSAKEAEDVLWISSRKEDWGVDLKQHDSKDWIECKSLLKHHKLLNSKIAGLELYSCELTGLSPGSEFDYRIRAGAREVFQATSKARKNAEQPIKFAIFGDCGAGTQSQLKIAHECYKYRPDLVVIPGDIVYSFGLFSEYVGRFFPVYNADAAGVNTGGPIMRSHLIVPVIGNHDIALSWGQPGTNLNRFPDALAYFTVWSQPLNGPVTKGGALGATPLSGNDANKNNFLESAGANFPVMANYSFDYGNTHWTVLDGNHYMDWTNDKLRSWVKADLANAKNATWKFVTFHQPGFSEDVEHSMEQRMRLLSDIFQENGVDVVWAGHVHNYQRSFPLLFRVNKQDGKPITNVQGAVPGSFTLDKEFDGKTKTKPKGVIYVVTGAGGQHLYPQRQQIEKVTMMAQFNGKVHSFTQCDINGDTMNVRQLDENGQPIDEFKVTKK